MVRLTALCIIAFLAGFAFARTDHTSAQSPPQGGLLSVVSHVTYDVRPDAGGVRVSWDMDLTDNDPATVYKYGSYVYYYASYGVPVLRGASNIVATGPGGGALETQLVEQGDSTVLAAKVTFDRELFYGNSYSFHLVYDLTQARADFDIVSPNYVFVPAIVVGDTSTARVITPSGADWLVSVQRSDCSIANDGQYHCGAPRSVQTAAMVEVIRAGAQLSLQGSVHTNGADVSLTINYFPGDEAWASHVRDLATQALPVLEELFGVPYSQPKSVSLSEGGQRELFGYAGLYSCTSSPCKISLSPASDDRTVIHELAHSWTTDFAARWLEEGIAEHVARQAAQQLGIAVREQDLPPPDVTVFPLDSWHEPTFIFGADQSMRRREASGYQRSRQLVELLEQTVGLPALQRAAAAAHEGGHVDSRLYMNLLEDASSQNLDGVFLDWVFPPDDAQFLRDRRAARDRFATFKQQVRAGGLEVPTEIQRAIDAWDFTPANNMLDRAAKALSAYESAKRQVNAQRSLWERLGLLGDDPGQEVKQAAAAFKSSDFEVATAHAQNAEGIINQAARGALYRALIAAAVVALAAGAVSVGLIVRSQRRRTVG